MKGDSVSIRSIYQLDSNTLLVDLSVPTGELDYNLTFTLIEVCNKYFYTYHNDKYILEAYLANNYVTTEVSSLTQLTNDAFRFKTPVFGSNAES